MERALTVALVDAPLPVNYEAAKAALADCWSTDEIARYEAQAVAMAAYARQMKDDTLLNIATRIRGRAVKRFGELYALLEAQRGANQGQLSSPTGEQSSTPKQEVAATLSPKQVEMASNVAAIPEDEFETLIESQNPPTKTALAKIGARHKQAEKPPAPWLQGRTPEEYNTAMHFVGAFEYFAKTLNKYPVGETVGMMDEKQAGDLANALDCIYRKLEELDDALQQEDGTIRANVSG